MRPRINQITTCANTSLNFYQSKERQEKDKRRAEFERNYNKNKKVFAGIEKSVELVNFSNNLAREIEMFKKSKRS